MRKLLLPSLALTCLGFSAQAQQRVSLLEVFTSSTCPPCTPGNAIYEGIVGPKPKTEYVSIKYQQNFPGNGDPYATTEGVNRRSYYAINSVPRMEIDGQWDGNGNSFTEALYQQYKAIPAEFKILGTYSVKNKVVTIKVKYTPLTAAAAAAGAKLHVAILESRDTANKKNNGETEFFHVMKKMLPTEAGITLPASTINKTDSLSTSFTFVGNYRLPADGQVASRTNHATEHAVENFNKILVVAWVQNPVDKKVFNAANMQFTWPAGLEQVSPTVGDVAVYPNPASTMVNLDFNMTEADNVTYSLINNVGAVVSTTTARMNAGKNHVTIDTKDLANGLYNVVVFDSHNNSFGQRLVVTH